MEHSVRWILQAASDPAKNCWAQPSGCNSRPSWMRVHNDLLDHGAGDFTVDALYLSQLRTCYPRIGVVGATIIAAIVTAPKTLAGRDFAARIGDRATARFDWGACFGNYRTPISVIRGQRFQ